ncbi:MAG: type II secretion system protein [Bdellovibrionota bacterium]
MVTKMKSMGVKGFSLVELMIVVAIIGILAAVAIPNFQRFQRKARQSEATSQLGGIHSAQGAFHGQWENYITDLRTVGYSPSGTLRYLHGFGAATGWSGMAPADYTGVAIVPGNNNTSVVGVAGVCATGPCVNACTGGCMLAAGSTVGGGTGNAATFTAESIGAIGGAVDDNWTMNQAKVLMNTMDGTL